MRRVPGRLAGRARAPHRRPLARRPRPLRAVLLAELLPIEAEYRRRRGERPRADEYAGRFPYLDSVALRRLVGVPAAARPDAPAPAGERFHPLRRVGQGACGTVWQAHDALLDRVIALKVPHPALVGSAEASERFRREARAAARLRHPGIVAVHEVASYGDGPALGELAADLRRWLRGEPVRARPVGRTVRWTRRRPTQAALLVVSGLLAVAVGAAGVSAGYNAELRRASAETDHARAAEAVQRERAEAGLYGQRVSLASREWEAGNIARVEQLLDGCPADRRGWEWEYLRRACHGELLSARHPAD